MVPKDLPHHPGITNTVLSVWPGGQCFGMLPKHPSTELILPAAAPNSSQNPDRGINRAFVYKSVVLRRDQQLLSLT